MTDEDRPRPSVFGRVGMAILVPCAVAAVIAAYAHDGWHFMAVSKRVMVEGAPAPFDGPLAGIAAWWIGCVGFALCAAWSVRLARADLAEHRLPNRDVLVVSIGTALPLSAAALLADQGSRVESGLIGAGFVCLPILLLWLISRGYGRPLIGAGDAKLAPIVGFVPGWVLADSVDASPLSVFPALLLFGLIGALIALARRGRGAELAFGPVMLAAMWFSTFIWPWIRSFGPTPAG